MKNDKPATAPLADEPDRSQLDWPFHAGVVEQVLAQVEIKVKRRQTRRRRLIKGGAAVLAFAGALLWAVPYVRDTATVETVAARRQTLALADGSQADLNARTSLRTDFRYGRRLVRLDRGEAYFAVAKDPEHPFLVETPAGTIRVTGTKFNVRLTPTGATEVTLLEGSLTVGAGLPRDGSEPNAERRTSNSELRTAISEARSIALTPGQQISTDKDGVRTLPPSALENVTAWRHGRLALDGLTLAEVAERLSSYHGRTIQVAPAASTLHPGGSLLLEDLPTALEALSATLPIQIFPMADGTYRIVPR